MPDQTGNTLTLTDLTTAGTAQINVDVSNPQGTISGSASLIVTEDPAPDVRAGLISHWPMDEATGSPAVTPDLYSRNDMAVVNMDASNLSDSPVGEALTFDGVEECGNRIEGYPISKVKSVWSCPGRPTFPQYEEVYDSWEIGYQYFGGIETWLNPLGSFPSRSPVRLSLAWPQWCLVADAALKIDSVWGAGRETAFKDMPQHRASGRSGPPAGVNQVFTDGSARWVKAENLHSLHSWNADGSRIAYFYQDDSDMPRSSP